MEVLTRTSSAGGTAMTQRLSGWSTGVAVGAEKRAKEIADRPGAHEAVQVLLNDLRHHQLRSVGKVAARQYRNIDLGSPPHDLGEAVVGEKHLPAILARAVDRSRHVVALGANPARQLGRHPRMCWCPNRG